MHLPMPPERVCEDSDTKLGRAAWAVKRKRKAGKRKIRRLAPRARRAGGVSFGRGREPPHTFDGESPMTARILGVVGSLRRKSYTRRVVLATLAAAREAGAETRVLDLAETALPLYNPDAKEPCPALDLAREATLWANGYVLGSPDYHGAMSGPIVNYLDYFWHEFTGKLFGYVCASHEKGLTVMDQMRTAVRQCYGWSLPYGIGFMGDGAFDESGACTDAKLAERVRMMGHDMAKYAPLLRGTFEADLAKSPRDPGFAFGFKG